MPSDEISFIKQDWFGAAVIESGSVEHCLDAVEKLLEERLELLGQIRGSLVPKKQNSSDRLTRFGKTLTPLEQTIMARVELLRPERPQAWFRAPAATTTGPFQTAHMQCPVFGKYNLQDIDLVKDSIKVCWDAASLAPLKFSAKGSLWGELINAKVKFQKIISLTGKFQQFTLKELPENIDDVHLTDSLKAFLRNVRFEVLNLNSRLENLFEILWDTSEKFWEYQQAEISKSRNFKFFAKDASKVRDAFKKRRQNTVHAPQKQSKHKKALSLMGFSTLPNMNELKKKYRELARTHHPDAGGDEVKFKQLTESYSLLAKKISNQVEFHI